MAETSDADLARIKAEEEKAAARIAERRRAGAVAETPREAKIALVAGVSILAGLFAIAVWSYASSHWFPASVEDTKPAAPPAPHQPSRGNDDDDPLIRKPKTGSGGGGGGGVSGGSGSSTPGEPAPPIPPGPLSVLKGLRAFLYEASHSPQAALTIASTPGASGSFPPGTLDGVPPDVLTNLQLAALRVARNPVIGIRVLGRSTHMAGTSYEIEVMSTDKQGGEVVSRSHVTLEPGADGSWRMTQVDPLEPFDEPEETAPATATPGMGTMGDGRPTAMGVVLEQPQASAFPYVIK